MKKPRPTRPKAIRERAAQTAAVIAPASPVAAGVEGRKKPFNPLEFFNGVRAEARKITWTTWKETYVTAGMVFIMVAITAAFFFALDIGLTAAMGAILRLATPGA